MPRTIRTKRGPRRILTPQERTRQRRIVLQNLRRLIGKEKDVNKKRILKAKLLLEENKAKKKTFSNQTYVLLIDVFTLDKPLKGILAWINGERGKVVKELSKLTKLKDKGDLGDPGEICYESNNLDDFKEVLHYVATRDDLKASVLKGKYSDLSKMDEPRDVIVDFDSDEQFNEPVKMLVATTGKSSETYIIEAINGRVILDRHPTNESKYKTYITKSGNEYFMSSESMEPIMGDQHSEIAHWYNEAQRLYKIGNKKISMSDEESEKLEFAVSNNLGRTLTQALLTLNGIIYNSNLKVTHPGSPTFNQEVIDATQGTKLSLWASCIKAASRRFGLETIECTALAIKLYSGVGNGHSFCVDKRGAPLQTTGSRSGYNIKYSRLVELLTEKEVDSKDYIERKTYGNRVVVYDVRRLKDVLSTVQNKTIKTFVALALKINEVDGDGDIKKHRVVVDKDQIKILTDDEMNSLVLENQIVYKEPEESEIKTDASINDLPTYNPILLAKILSFRVSSGFYTKAELVENVEMLRTSIPFFAVERYEDEFFENLYVIITLKEYLKLLGSVKKNFSFDSELSQDQLDMTLQTVLEKIPSDHDAANMWTGQIKSYQEKYPDCNTVGELLGALHADHADTEDSKFKMFIGGIKGMIKKNFSSFTLDGPNYNGAQHYIHNTWEDFYTIKDASITEAARVSPYDIYNILYHRVGGDITKAVKLLKEEFEERASKPEFHDKRYFSDLRTGDEELAMTIHELLRKNVSSDAIKVLDGTSDLNVGVVNIQLKNCGKWEDYQISIQKLPEVEPPTLLKAVYEDAKNAISVALGDGKKRTFSFVESDIKVGSKKITFSSEDRIIVYAGLGLVNRSNLIKALEEVLPGVEYIPFTVPKYSSLGLIITEQIDLSKIKDLNFKTDHGALTHANYSVYHMSLREYVSMGDCNIESKKTFSNEESEVTVGSKKISFANLFDSRCSVILHKLTKSGKWTIGAQIPDGDDYNRYTKKYWYPNKSHSNYSTVMVFKNLGMSRSSSVTAEVNNLLERLNSGEVIEESMDVEFIKR